MKIKFLHLADVHLGCKNFYLAEKARDRSEDFRLAFRDAVEFALEPRNAIDGVLISGNLFEYHRPEVELWNFAKGLLSRLLAKNIIVAVVPGLNDSYAYKNSVYRTERLPGIDLFLNTEPSAPKTHEIGGKRVFLHGLCHVPGQTPDPLPAFPIPEEKGINIALLNGVLDGRRGEDESEHNMPLDAESLGTAGFDYVALGGRKAFEEAKVGKTPLVYPGSLEGRSFAAAERGDRGPVVVTFDDSGTHVERCITNRKSVEAVTLDLRGEKITDAGGLENALMTLGGPNRIVQVTLTGTAEFVADLDEVHEKVEDDFYHLEIIDESRLVDSAMLRKIESENTIRGYFVRKLNARIERLESKIHDKGQNDALLRELKVCEKAMKMGVEQFIEEESPQDSLYSLIPESDERVEVEELKKSVGVEDLEQKVKAMLEYRRKFSKPNEEAESPSTGNGNGNGVHAPEQEARAEEAGQ